MTRHEPTPAPARARGDMLQSVIGLGDDTTGTASDSGEKHNILTGSYKYTSNVVKANCLLLSQNPCKKSVKYFSCGVYSEQNMLIRFKTLSDK